MPEKYKAIIETALYTGGIGSFGGISYYLYQVSKGKDFKWTMFFINILLAFFIGYVVGEFLPHSQYHNGLIAISGFSSYPLLDVLERKGAGFILKFLPKGK